MEKIDVKGTFFQLSDGHEMWVHEFGPSDAQHCLLLVHGMAEHGARYERFGAFLAERNWRLVVPDLRGHGKTAKKNGLHGSFGPGGWKRVLDDLVELSDHCARQTQGRFAMMGHSMGSMLALAFAESGHRPPHKLVLSAFPPHPGLLVHAGKFMSALASALLGANKPSPFMDQLTFGKFAKGIAKPRTRFDWLSNDPLEVDAYIADPDCGAVFTNGFFGELARLTDSVHKGFSRLPKSVSYLLIAGSDDPVVEKQEGISRNRKKFTRVVAGMFHTRIYPGGRHELLNDTMREEVMKDVHLFLSAEL